METGRKRTRRDFAPLTVSVSVAVSTAFSPATQVYTGSDATFEPDRQISPTVIQPSVMANANDGSWPYPNANSRMANMVWTANGVDISTLPEWSGKYSVDTVGATRGGIRILRNLLPSERIAMQFRADLVDERLGVTIPVVTDPVILSTVDKSADSYGISIGESRQIYYNPFLDRLHLYEFKVSHGLLSPSPADEEDADDANSYRRLVPVEVFKGAEKVTDGYSLKLYRVDNVDSLTELAAANEVLQIAPAGITLDLRLIGKADYMIKAFVGTREVAKLQFSVSRVYPSFSCEPSNETGILPTQTQRYDQAMVNSEGRIVECPGSVIRISWFTDTSAKKSVRHNEGDRTLFGLDKTGIGHTHSDDWLEVYTEAIQKNPYCMAVDESGNQLTDENGNNLIIN